MHAFIMQGAYRRDARALVACTYLKAGNVLAWRADGSRMAPTYYVAGPRQAADCVHGAVQRRVRLYKLAQTNLAVPEGASDVDGKFRSLRWLPDGSQPTKMGGADG